MGKIKLEGEHSQFVLNEMIRTHRQRLEQRARYDDAIEAAASKPEYATYVAGLSVLQGIDRLSAMTILSELGDLRRRTIEGPPRYMKGSYRSPSLYLSLAVGSFAVLRRSRLAATQRGCGRLRMTGERLRWSEQILGDLHSRQLNGHSQRHRDRRIEF